MAAVARWQDPHLAPSRRRSRGTRLLASQCGQTICNASAMTSSHRGSCCKLCLARSFTLIGVNFSKTTRIAFCRNSFLSPCAAPSTKPFRSLMARLMAFKACWCPSPIYLFSRRVGKTNGHSRLHELLPRSTTDRVLHVRRSPCSSRTKISTRPLPFRSSPGGALTVVKVTAPTAS